MKKTWLSLLSVTFLIATLLAGCGNNSQEKEEKRNQSSDTSGGGMHSSGTGQ
ncbi:hypothetical protein [Anoxybacteroides tepidamans]|uniref:hypothetical protein n=1 Tax=Anoxybacteroides tepidamans TaxID=265948 RepID=UPI0018DCFF53|nr:hypothetical protein [Anoxybacillus tepidamans]